MPAAGEIPFAVVGAHLSDMPLNRELLAAGARLIERGATAPHYRLYALPGTQPPPGSIGLNAASNGVVLPESRSVGDAAG